MSNFVNNFINTMLKLPGAKLSPNRREIICDCPICGARKHFYIKVPIDNTISCYHCFNKCQSSGVITPSILMKWMLSDDPQILIELSNYNKIVSNLPKNRIYTNTQIYKLNNIYISQGTLSDTKLKYLNWRLGTNLSFQDLLNQKIILNIYDLLNTNRISNYSRAPMIMDQINSSFLGFLSYDNAYINMRRLVNEDKVDKSLSKRYNNYNIFNKYDNSMKYYILPSKINLSIPKRIKVNIAEGPMDILSIFYNVVESTDHNIFAAITGSSYFQMVQFFLIDLKLSYIEIHLYPDNDKNDNEFYKISQLLYYHNIPFYIHRNTMENEKDFGVPKEKIKEIVYQI